MKLTFTLTLFLLGTIANGQGVVWTYVPTEHQTVWAEPLQNGSWLIGGYHSYVDWFGPVSWNASGSSLGVVDRDGTVATVYYRSESGHETNPGTSPEWRYVGGDFIYAVHTDRFDAGPIGAVVTRTSRESGLTEIVDTLVAVNFVCAQDSLRALVPLTDPFDFTYSIVTYDLESRDTVEISNEAKNEWPRESTHAYKETSERVFADSNRILFAVTGCSEVRYVSPPLGTVTEHSIWIYGQGIYGRGSRNVGANLATEITFDHGITWRPHPIIEVTEGHRSFNVLDDGTPIMVRRLPDSSEVVAVFDTVAWRWNDPIPVPDSLTANNVWGSSPMNIMISSYEKNSFGDSVLRYGVLLADVTTSVSHQIINSPEQTGEWYLVDLMGSMIATGTGRFVRPELTHGVYFLVRGRRVEKLVY